jgi:hypothetical protein
MFQLIIEDWSGIYVENYGKSSTLYFFALAVLLIGHFVLLKSVILLSPQLIIDINDLFYTISLVIAVFINNLQSARKSLAQKKKIKKVSTWPSQPLNGSLRNVDIPKTGRLCSSK